MSTRTLGIKFEVAGIKEAQSALNNFKSNLEKTLGANRKAVAETKKQSYKNKQVKNNFNNALLKRSINKYKRAVDRAFREWKIENFGSNVQKQNLTIRRERKEFRQRSTYKDLTRNNRALVLEFRLAYRDFFGKLSDVLDDKQNPSFLEKSLGALAKPINFAFDAVLFPFQSALAGAFERMGEVQVQDFAEGFNKSLQRGLGLSFEETGGDVGKMIGNSMFKVYQRSIESVDDFVKGKLKFNLADIIIEGLEYTTRTIAKELPNMILRTHRRIQINKKAIPEARRAAGLRMIENDLPEKTKKDIEENQSITLIYGGANTDKADIGKDYTARVMKPYLKGSAVIPLSREWTNSAVDSDFQGDMRNLIKLILSNNDTAQVFKSFVSENGLSSLGDTEKTELMAGLDIEGELDLANIDRLAEIIESLMGNKDFALGKALQATFKGFNPDDVLGAAEAISIMEQFPDKPLQIGGFSHGGYNALGTVDLLNRMGYDQVKGFSIGTPITGANATVNPDNFKSFMGDRDYYYKALTGLGGEDIDFPEFFEVGEREGALHSLQGYVRGDSVKGGLQEFLGDRVQIPSKENYGKKDSAYGYAVGELGAETAIVRTLLTYMGEKQLGNVEAGEGFIFSAEESLPGYTGNLEKLGRGLKDEDTKKFHDEYIDFLKTLQEELEIAEKLAAIGKEYKPLESLQKAANIFPQLESLAAKNPAEFNSEQESIFDYEAKQNNVRDSIAEAEEKEKLVFFKRKVAQQKDNIERTFQSMLGRKFSKKDEDKGIYSFYNSEEYEERAGNFEGMVDWLENTILDGASPEEMQQAQPTIDLLKKITDSIRETGSTGNFDLSTARSAEELLGIDLREFDLLFKQFENKDESKIDVNRFKEELRTFRRNREQLLNERTIPENIDKGLDSAREKLNSVDVVVSEGSEPENIELNTEQLKEAFSNYLNELVRRGTEYGTQVLSSNSDFIDSGDFNEAEISANFAKLNDEFKKTTREYRTAISEGNTELSKDLAENLLFQSASLKRIYSELSNKIQDTDVLRSMRGFASNATSVQTEILRGQPNLRGRVSQGLPDLMMNSPELQESVRNIDFGADIRDGVERIINSETGEEIGYQFVLGINEGGEEAADINSPSRVWQWIGKMIKDGFVSGVEGIGNFLSGSLVEGADSAEDSVSSVIDAISGFAAELDNSEGLLDPLFETEGLDEEVSNVFTDLIEKAGEFFDTLVEKFPVIGRVADFLAEIGGEVLQVLGIFSLGEALIGFSSEALEASMQLESLEKSILAVSSSSIKGAENIAFIRKQAKELSIDLISAEESYTRILGATRNTPLEGLQTEQIFTTLATTAKNRGLSTDATNRMFLGFEQVIAKNEFKSEEVRGQLAEVLGDIQNLLATSVGVPLSQLGVLMEAGDLKVADVMPKLLAQLNAQNAAVGSSSQTAHAAQTRLNNAILEFKDSFGRRLQPVQKMGLNRLSSALEVLHDKSTLILKFLVGLFTTMVVNLSLKLLATRVALVGIGQGMDFIISAIARVLPKLLVFLKRFVLISVAIEVWTNNIKLARNSFPELQSRIEGSTKRLDALREAFDKTGVAAANYATNQSKNMQLEEGIKLPKWLQGLAGGERLNLDNLIRNRIKNNGGILPTLMKIATSVLPGGKIASEAIDEKYENAPSNFVSQADKKQQDFIIAVGELLSKSDTTLSFGIEAKSVLSEIQKLDAKTRELQSKRLDILPGDNQALQEALEAEKEILKERDKLLAKTSQYQQSLQGEIQDVKDTLLELAGLERLGGTDEQVSARANLRSSLEEKLSALESEKKDVDRINSEVPKFLSQIDRVLRNSDERSKGFIADQEDDAVVSQAEAIKESIEQGLTDADLEIKLDNLSASDLQHKISFIQKEIKHLEDKLGSAYLQEGVEGLEASAEAQGLELSPDTLERMLEEGRSSQETKAAQILLALDEYEAMADQAQLGLADLLKNNRNKLRGYNRTVSEYFFKINQQLLETELEAKRLLNEILYTDIKNKLSSAIAPGTNTFVDGIIDNVQNVINQASQVAQKIFGDKAAALGFRSESRSLKTEMIDFVRQVGNATKAVQQFTRRLQDGVSVETGKPVKTKDIVEPVSVSSTATSKKDTITRSKGVFPIKGLTPNNVRVTSPFGMRTIFGRRKFHAGVDFDVKGGTKVHAVNDGIVKRIKPLADQMQVGVETAKGVVEWFIHLGQKLNVKLGDKVKAGDLIGKVAHTTQVAKKARVSTGDHLDYRVYKNGKAIEPMAYLKASIARKAETASIPASTASTKTGGRFSDPAAFAAKTTKIANKLGISPKALMTIMLFESAGTLDPQIQGPEVKWKGKSQGKGRGLIQFMPATAKLLKTTDGALGGMNQLEQLDYVDKYFSSFKNFGAGKLENLYAAVLAGNPLKVNASDGYVTARIGAKKMEKQFGAKAESLLKAVSTSKVASNTKPVPAKPVPAKPVSSTTTVAVKPATLVSQTSSQQQEGYSDKAIAETQKLIDAKQRNLDINKITTEQERTALNQQAVEAIANNKRQSEETRRQNNRSVEELRQKFDGFDTTYSFASADREAQEALKGIRREFKDIDLGIVDQIRDSEDTIKAIEKALPVLAEQIPQFEKIGTPEALAAAQTQRAAKVELQRSLVDYKVNLEKIKYIQSQAVVLEAQHTKFIRMQNGLKTEQEKLNRKSLSLNQKAQISEERGSMEAKQQLKIQQEELRLTLKLNELKQQYAPGEFLDGLIDNERHQSQINKDNINHQGVLTELDLEKRLLDYEDNINGKNAGFMDRYGDKLGADKLRKSSAVAQENLRFERELIELKKEFAGEPEKLQEFVKAATQLNSVNLSQIDNEFQSLSKTIESNFISSTQGFFQQVATNFFDGRAERESSLVQQKLAYAEQLNQLNDQYGDTPGQLAHLKNRARELNEQKLDKINSQFSIFRRLVDLAGQAIMEFVKQLAAMVAQQAASALIEGVLGSIFGGISGSGPAIGGNDFGGNGAASFMAAEGGTVGAIESFSGGGSISSRRLSNKASSFMKNTNKNVRNAFLAEGTGAQLGVFHNGEELLSAKNGEAGRYQALKSKFGANPLDKILHYANGGTVGFDAGSNILNGFKSNRNRIDLSGLNNKNKATTVNRSLNITQQIFTPNQDSFVLNADQRNQDLMESLKRGF